MGHPSVKDWEKDEAILASGTKGFNVLTELPRLLSKHYPWLQDFRIGFCDKNQLQHWGSIGWAFLRTEHFEIDNFNQAVGLRFGLVDDGGNIKFRDNYLMIMPKDFRKRQINMRNEEADRMISAQTEGQKYVSPADPRGQELLGREDMVYATSDERVIKVAPTEDKPTRGRPRKS